MSRIQVPEVLRAATRAAIGPERTDAWIQAVPFIFNELFDRWTLRYDPVPGAPWAGCESLVVPVLTADSTPAVVRVAAPSISPSQSHEQILEALRIWDGHGAVRVYREDTSFRATLQERLITATNLGTLPLEQVPAVWGALLRALTVPAANGFLRVQDIAAGWLAQGPAGPAVLGPAVPLAPSDRYVFENAEHWARVAAASAENWLIHADLHYYNILAGNPDAHGVATWKAIDPQPLAGPTAYAVAPLLWNRLYDLPAAAPEDQAAWLRAFAQQVCQEAGVDPAFGLGLSVAREVQNLRWYARTAADGDAKAAGDAARSLWVARALSGVSVQGTDAHRLKRIG